MNNFDSSSDSDSVSDSPKNNFEFVGIPAPTEKCKNLSCNTSSASAKKGIKRKQKYKKSWEKIPELNSWLKAEPNNVYLALCKYCNINISASVKRNLFRHANTKKHEENAKIFQQLYLSNNIPNKSVLMEKNDSCVINRSALTAASIEDSDSDSDSNSVAISHESNLSASSWRKRKKQQYKKSWETIPECRGWLTADPKNNCRGFCKYCNISLTISGQYDLRKHSNTKKHQENSSSLMEKYKSTSVSAAKQNNNVIPVTIPITDETLHYPFDNSPTLPKSNRKRRKRYKQSWEAIPEYSNWLTKVPNNDCLAFCKCCNITLDRSVTKHLQGHANSRKHQKKLLQFQSENIENEYNSNVNHLIKTTKIAATSSALIERSSSDLDADSDSHINGAATPKRNRRYEYQKIWETLPECRGWLMAEPNNNYLAFCKYCNVNLSMSGKKDLFKHSKTKKHNENLKTIQLQPNLSANIKNDPSLIDNNVINMKEYHAEKEINNASTSLNVIENPTSDSDSVLDLQENRPASTKKKLQYQKSWEVLPECKDWLMAEPNNVYLAFCKYCKINISMSAKKDLIRHSKTNKHQRNSNRIQLEPELWKCNKNDLGNNDSSSENNDSNLEENVRDAEILLSAFCVEHDLPFKAMDQLSQLIKKICHDSRIASKISCGSKNTTAIIKNVIGTTHFQLICEAMRNQCFSIYFDAESPPSSSTSSSSSSSYSSSSSSSLPSRDDYCSTTKLLSVIVRIRFNDKIRDMFLTMIKVNNTKAETLFAHIIKFFNDNDIDYKKNLIGIAADATTVITGGTNSVAKLLEKVCPDLKIFKCVSHSFNLCSSYAAEKLPESLEILVRNIYNYLSNNPNNRLAGFDKIQSILEHKPIKMLHPYQSRWLSLEPLVRSISGRYNCLTIYFNNIVHFDKIGNNAKYIFDQLNNPLNELFLQFLNFILPKINKFNKLVQSDSPQIFKLYAEMRNIIQSILQCFIKPIYLNKCEIQKIQFNDPTNILPLNGIYCGDQVNVTMSLNEKLTTDQKRFFKIKCLDYYVELCTQIYKRFKFNDEFLRLCNIIDPEVVKSRQETDSISILSHYFQSFNTTNELFQKIHNEWTQLISLDFDSLFDDYSLSAISVEDFWYRIFDLKYENENEIALPTLKELVLHVLTLPNSSANVERIFSLINLNKIKIKHTFNTETLTGILHTKEYLLDDRI